MTRKSHFRWWTGVSFLVVSLHANILAAAGLFGRQVDTSSQLVNCINEAAAEEYSDSATTWDGAMSDHPARLIALGSWWSEKPQLIPLTIVTQLSANRWVHLNCK